MQFDSTIDSAALAMLIRVVGVTHDRPRRWSACVGGVVEARWRHFEPDTGIWTVRSRSNKEDTGRMKSDRPYSLRLPDRHFRQLANPSAEFVFESPATRGHFSPNALMKSLKCFDASLTNHGFRNAIKEFCRRAEPPLFDHVAHAFCNHALKGTDASYRCMDTSQGRAALTELLYSFITQSQC